MPLSLRYVARSDVGLVREGNEDSGYAGPRLLVVADGMGGHAAGEVASTVVVETLSALEHTVDTSDPLTALEDAVHKANARLRGLVSEDRRLDGMGTTITAVLWAGDQVGIVHIGDSRLYLLRGGDLRRVTHDHTYVQSLVDEGRISEVDVGSHPARSLLLRALDGRGAPEPDLQLLQVEAGDRLLLCSDGLTGVVADPTLREVLAGEEALEAAADRLVELALKGGAPDNVTCVVADVVEVEHAPAPDDTAESFTVGAASGQPEGSRRPVAHDEDHEDVDSPHDAADDELEEMRYAPRPPSGWRWVRRGLLLLGLVALLVWGGLQAREWVDRQYYVAADDDQVAIFRGIDSALGPLELSRVAESPGNLPVAALPPAFEEQVSQGIPAEGLADARRIVARLRASACAAVAAGATVRGLSCGSVA